MKWSAAAARLTEAGCRLDYYQPLKWYRLHRANNRTHRELLIVDGRIAFVGGAGVADWWHEASGPDDPAWRDTMVRVEGPVVASLQGVFAENWLECGGEILTSPACWPPLASAGPVDALVIRSSPSDRATTSRVAFQLLMACARKSIDIHTPYFLPDKTLRRALVETVARGVRIRVLVPGPRTDQRLVRLASRRLYDQLLEKGVRIFEYQPGMTHAKVLMIDDRWAIVGTTNFDNRSFEHNDEVNVAFCDRDVATRLRQDFEADLAQSTRDHARRLAAASAVGEGAEAALLAPRAAAMTAGRSTDRPLHPACVVIARGRSLDRPGDHGVTQLKFAASSMLPVPE